MQRKKESTIAKDSMLEEEWPDKTEDHETQLGYEKLQKYHCECAKSIQIYLICWCYVLIHAFFVSD